MANRRDGKKQQKKAEDELSWGEVATLATAGLAIAGGIAYGLSQLFGTTTTNTSPDRPGNSWVSDSTDQSPAGLRPTGIFPVSQRSYLPQDTRAIVMAVDATPSRGGGLLICHQKETIYYYSLDWTDYLTFPSDNQQPDKFETANAFIALKLFIPTIKEIKDKFNLEDKVTIKVDNSKFSRNRGRPDKPNEDDLFWESVQQQKTNCNGKWEYSHADQNDTAFLSADYLSKGRDIRADLYPEYIRYNCNEYALNVLQRELHKIPSRYRYHV